MSRVRHNKRFKGDDCYTLPEGWREPYRLWFYSLQLAKRAGLDVDNRFYEDWGDFEKMDFKEWWELNWRQLFAVPIGVKTIRCKQDFEELEEGSFLVVPLNQSFTRTKEELARIYEANPWGKTATKRKGRYNLTSKHMKVEDIRHYLQAYEFRLGNEETGELSIQDVAVKFCEWAERWDEVRGNRPAIRSVPILNLVRLIRSGEQITGDTYEFKTVQRMCRSGRRIVENSARGEFPGTYS